MQGCVNSIFQGCLHPLSHLIRSNLVVFWALSLSSCALIAVGFCYSSCLYVKIGGGKPEVLIMEQREILCIFISSYFILQMCSNQDMHRFSPPSRARTRLEMKERCGQMVSDKSSASGQHVMPPGKPHHCNQPLFFNQSLLLSSLARRHSLG